MDEDIEDHMARRASKKRYLDSSNEDEEDEDEAEDDEEDKNSDDNTPSSPSPNVGSKRRRASKDANEDNPFRRAIKVQASVGRPKAADYESSVRAILSVAFSLFRGRLVTQGPYPDQMLENVWAKHSWNEACKQLTTNISFNSELLRMVCGFLYAWIYTEHA